MERLSQRSSNLVLSLRIIFEAERSLPSESREICGVTLKFWMFGCDEDFRDEPLLDLPDSLDDEVDVFRVGVVGSGS